MICVYLKSPDPDLSPVWNGLCIYYSKVRLLMKSFRTLAGALLPSLRGRSSIGMAPFPTYFPPRLAPANQSVSNKPGDLLNSRWIAADTQLRGSIE